jgi:hypothetical protein
MLLIIFTRRFIVLLPRTYVSVINMLYYYVVLLILLIQAMNTKTQTEKNLKLSEKLADFLVSHPEVSKALPDDASFVTFSAEDTQLNETNDELIKELLEEGKHVVKAQETNNEKKPWEFSPIAA